MVNAKSKKKGDLLLLANGIVALILLNLISAEFFTRIDLTEDKRYSIKPHTKEMLGTLDDQVFIEVYLAGDLNAGFTRFQKAIEETLEEFRIYSNNKVQAVFIDPATALSEKARGEFMAHVASKGIQPTNVIDNQNGQRVQKVIFPGALVSYGSAEEGVMLLKGNKARTPEEEINQSIEGIEYEIANAIYKLTSIDRKHIGLVKGHGELDSLDIASFYRAMRSVYDVTDTHLENTDLSKFDALVIAKPTQTFSSTDKFSLDQYVMNGGNVLLLIDKLEASMDSAATPGYFAFPYNLGIDDQLFRYGVRINPNLIQDRHAGLYPVVVRETGGRPQVQLMDWPFFPLINRYADHPVTRNLDAVIVRFISSIDTVKAEGVKKTPLLFTSEYARAITAPVSVDVNAATRNPDPNQFDQKFLPVGYLLEGTFTSLYKNRFLPDGANENSFKESSKPAKFIVVADGDLAKNQVNARTHKVMPLGFDAATNYTFANQDLLMNMLAYLTDENGLISARNKEVKIRPLDRQRIAGEKLKWQILNLAGPLVILIAFGLVRSFLRKRKYTAFS